MFSLGLGLGSIRDNRLLDHPLSYFDLLPYIYDSSIMFVNLRYSASSLRPPSSTPTSFMSEHTTPQWLNDNDDNWHDGGVMDGIETVSCVCEQQVDDHTFFVIADMEDTRSAISYSGADDYLTMSTNSVNPSDLDDSVIVISDDEEEDVRTTTISQNYANITQYTKLEDLRSSNPNIKITDADFAHVCELLGLRELVAPNEYNLTTILDIDAQLHYLNVIPVYTTDCEEERPEWLIFSSKRHLVDYVTAGTLSL